MLTDAQRAEVIAQGISARRANTPHMANPYYRWEDGYASAWSQGWSQEDRRVSEMMERIETALANGEKP